MNFWGQKSMNYPENGFVLEYLLDEQLLLVWFLILFIFTKNHLVKSCSTFVGTHLSCLTSYQKNQIRKIIWVQKSIEFYLKRHKNPQTSACYCRMLSVVNFFKKDCSLKRKDIITLIHKIFQLVWPPNFEWFQSFQCFLSVAH